MVEARTAKAKQDEVDKQSAEVVQHNRRAALAQEIKSMTMAASSDEDSDSLDRRCTKRRTE